MGKFRFAKKIRALQAAQAAQAAAAQAQAAKAEQERQALANASAITDSGRTTDKVAANTTQQASADSSVANNTGAPATGLDDDTSLYINNLANRRKKRGAPLAQMNSVLGQAGNLGV